MTEDPEQVLPQQRVGAAATEKNVASNDRWNISRNSATVITGMANTSRNCTTSDHPREDRHLHQRHARCAHVEDGDDQVDGAGQRGDAGDLQAEAQKSTPWRR
jgi:hypothetical protein